VPPEHGDRQQREARLARQRDRGPGHAGRVGVTGALDQDGARGDDDRRQQDLPARTLPLQRRAERPEQDRHARHGHRDHGGLGVGDATHDRHVEQDQSCRGDPGQPEPFGTPRLPDRDAQAPDEDQQDHGGYSVADRLGQEQRRRRQSAGDRDAAPDQDHGRHGAGDAADPGPAGRWSFSHGLTLPQ
jgi:hypothetical protein